MLEQPWRASDPLFANRDYGAARRVMHRITLRGDEPVGVGVLRWRPAHSAHEAPDWRVPPVHG